MNRERRKEIKALADRLSEIKDAIETLQSDEQEYADNMPENLQGGERHDRAETAASNLQEAADSLESAIDSLIEAAE